MQQMKVNTNGLVFGAAKKYIGLILLTLCSAFLPLVANAGTVEGTIDTVLVRESDGLTYFMISGTATGKPACATNTYWMIRDENSEAGKKQFSMVLAAKMAGATVKVVGANTCTRWVDGEDVLTLYIT